MTNTSKALVIVLVLNTLMILFQMSINNVAIENDLTPTAYGNVNGSILMDFKQDDDSYLLDTTGYDDYLPTTEGIEGGEGNEFTDIFSSIRNWFGSITNYVKSILTTPYTFLSMFGMSQEFTFVLSALWYAMTLFFLVSFLWGRE